MSTFSDKFEIVTRKHPELKDVAESFRILLRERPGLDYIDDVLIEHYISNRVSAREIVLFISALIDEGLCRPKLRIVDNEGHWTSDEPFDDYDERPAVADDRHLNQFEVGESNIVPYYELIA